MRPPSVLLLAASASAIAAATGLGAAHAAAGGAAVSAPGCTPRAPVLLSEGATPRRQLRLNLARISGVTKRATSVERVDSKSTLADGSVQPGSSTRRISEVFRTGKLANGHVPYVARLGVTFPGSAGTDTSPLTVYGHFDARNGGAVSAKGGRVRCYPAIFRPRPWEPVQPGAA